MQHIDFFLLILYLPLPIHMRTHYLAGRPLLFKDTVIFLAGNKKAIGGKPLIRQLVPQHVDW